MIAENNSARDVLFKIRVAKIEAFPPRFTKQELEGEKFSEKFFRGARNGSEGKKNEGSEKWKCMGSEKWKCIALPKLPLLWNSTFGGLLAS